MNDDTDWQDLAITAMARSAELTEHWDEAMDSRNALADLNRDLCGLLTQAKQRIAALEAERDEAMNLLGAASASNATLEQAVRAANALVTKLRVVHDDPRYQGVWQLSQAHFGPYSGPKYNEELDALIAALAGEEKS